MLLASSRHRGKPARELLHRQPFIRYERQSWTGHEIDRYLKEADIKPIDRFELNSIESIALMVNLDLGVAIVPMAANLLSPQLNITPIGLNDFKEPRRFGLIWSRSSPKIRLIEAFLEAASIEYYGQAI